MSHSLGNDKIYEELRGYFPPEYDLTPDELEKEIELENKKRELALAMMRVQNAKDTFVPSGKAIARSSISSMHTDHEIPIIKNPSSTEKSLPKSEPKIEDITAPEAPVTKQIDAETEEFISTAPIILKEQANDVIPPVSEDTDDMIIPVLEDDELPPPSAYPEPLEELIDEMENTSAISLFDDEYEDATEEDKEELENARKPVNFFFDFLEIFAICITCIIVVFAMFFRLTRVSGESMQDTLYENEYLIVSDLFYEPKCGDIVVIQNTALENELLKEPLVKRVIAVGGQSVDIAANGMVTVTHQDGTKEVLDQQYIKKQPYASVSGHYEVPEGFVFVMGDNRNHSTDSRSPMVGVIDERCIFGKALLRVLPFSAFTVFENPYND